MTEKSETCAHVLAADPDLKAAVDYCEECVKTGDEWVELRVCKTCGHVGCCDNSKNRHARAHWHATDHAVVGPAGAASAFGEWLWCFEHDAYVLRGGRIRHPTHPTADPSAPDPIG